MRGVRYCSADEAQLIREDVACQWRRNELADGLDILDAMAVTTSDFGRHAASLAVILSAAMLGAACSASVAESGAPRATSVTSRSVRHLTQGEHVEVGDYDLLISRVRLLSDPQVGPDLPSAPPLSPGALLVLVEIEITNNTEKPIDVPDPRTFRLLGGDGSRYDGSVGMWRGRADESSSADWAPTSDIAAAPIRPGEILFLEPEFVVPAEDVPLTLEWTPLEGRETVVELHVRGGAGE